MFKSIFSRLLRSRSQQDYLENVVPHFIGIFKTDSGDLVAGFVESALVSNLGQELPVLLYDQHALQALVREIHTRAAAPEISLLLRDKLIRESDALGFGLGQLDQAMRCPIQHYNEPPNTYRIDAKDSRPWVANALLPECRSSGLDPRHSVADRFHL